VSLVWAVDVEVAQADDLRTAGRQGTAHDLIGEQLGMPLSRPMPVVGPGVAELRVRGEDGQFRAFYFTASEEGILVVHAFAKKTQQTPPADIKLARKRLKEMLDDQWNQENYCSTP
jgi:phage-related protein